MFVKGNNALNSNYTYKENPNQIGLSNFNNETSPRPNFTETIFQKQKKKIKSKMQEFQREGISKKVPKSKELK